MDANVRSGHRSWTQSRAGRVVSFVAITWSIAGGFLLLQEGLPTLADFANRLGVIPDSLVVPASQPATSDCAAAVQRARASTTDPGVTAQARFLVWRMGFHTGFAAGIANATAGSTAAVDPGPLLAQQPRQIAQLLGVDAPTLPPTQHTANALTEFSTFVAQDPRCVATQLADKYSPREAALYKFALIVGHAAVYRIALSGAAPRFVPEIRLYGKQAEIPLELLQPFVDNTLDSLPGSGPEHKVQFAVGRLEEHLKANR